MKYVLESQKEWDFEVKMENYALSNNTAELRGIIVALRWALRDSRSTVLRYDSKYAAMMTLGEWRPKKNKALVAEARKAWREAHAAKGGRLWMKHVKGHSGDRWNDRADGLADEGRRGTRRSGADSAFGWA